MRLAICLSFEATYGVTDDLRLSKPRLAVDKRPSPFTVSSTRDVKIPMISELYGVRSSDRE